MTKNELLDIVTVIVMSYPDRFKEESIPGMVTAWYAFFKDDDKSAVELAVTKHIASNKWPPSIAEIRESMAEILHPELIPPDIAWMAVMDVMHATGESSWGRPTFPPLIERVVETIGWHTLWELHRGSYAGNKDGMDKVAFMDLYKPTYEREMQTAALPAALSASIRKIRQLCPETDSFLLEVQNIRRKEDKKWELISGKAYKELDTPKKTNLLEDKK